MILLTQETGFLKPIAWVLGQIFNLLFKMVYALDNLFGNVNLPIVGICVILFTIVIKLIMLPLTMKQQRFSKLSNMMNPEIQAIQAKYKDRRDTDSMMKMNAETKAVYAKYGASPSSGCLPLLIQLPIMFALYRVIYKIPGYVTQIKEVSMNIYDAISKADLWQSVVGNADVGLNTSSTTAFVDSAYNLSKADWSHLASMRVFAGQSDVIIENGNKLVNMTNFFGLNLTQNPGFVLSWALLIPILAGVTQWLSARLSMSKDQLNNNNGQNSMAGSMKMMNTIMPLMSVFFCITLPACIGIYWITSSLVQIVQQIIINKKMDNVDIEQLMQANIDKVNAKRAKKGLPPQKITNTASTYVEEVKKQEARAARKEERDEEIKKSTDYYSNSGKSGSLAAKANMVKMYNERNNSGKKKDEE